MFRRNRPFAQNSPLNAAQIEVLTKANQMVANGNPGDAAPLFAQLARDLGSNHPRRAANLHAVAAHAYADSANEALALAQARAALGMFIQNNMVNRTPVFYANISRKFDKMGMKTAASTLQNEFGEKVGAKGAQVPARPPTGRGVIPTNCPKCGAPLSRASATWINDQTAECEYCGSAIRATN